MPKSVTTAYGPGTRVKKTTGDYSFFGEILLAFEKRSGQVRWLVEDDRGLVLIWNERQITGAAIEPYQPQTFEFKEPECEMCHRPIAQTRGCKWINSPRCAQTKSSAG